MFGWFARGVELLTNTYIYNLYGTQDDPTQVHACIEKYTLSRTHARTQRDTQT